MLHGGILAAAICSAAFTIFFPAAQGRASADDVKAARLSIAKGFAGPVAFGAICGAPQRRINALALDAIDAITKADLLQDISEAEILFYRTAAENFGRREDVSTHCDEALRALDEALSGIGYTERSSWSDERYSVLGLRFGFWSGSLVGRAQACGAPESELKRVAAASTDAVRSILKDQRRQQETIKFTQQAMRAAAVRQQRGEGWRCDDARLALATFSSIFIGEPVTRRYPPNQVPMFDGKASDPESRRINDKFVDDALSKGYTRRRGAEEAVTRGFEFIDRDDYETAMKRFNQAWLLDPEYAEVYRGFAVLTFLRDRNPERADALFRHGLQTAKPEADTFASYAHFLLFANRPREAVPILEEALERHPTAPRLRTYLAVALLQTGQKARGCSVAREALAAAVPAERPAIEPLLAEC